CCDPRIWRWLPISPEYLTANDALVRFDGDRDARTFDTVFDIDRYFASGGSSRSGGRHFVLTCIDTDDLERAVIARHRTRWEPAHGECLRALLAQNACEEVRAADGLAVRIDYATSDRATRAELHDQSRLISVCNGDRQLAAAAVFGQRDQLIG